MLAATLLALVPVPLGPAAADPWVVNNPDGTSDAVWNFTNPADYALTDVEITGGIAGLAPQAGWWNSTSGADFSGPDSATNIDLARYPGDVILASTSGSSTLLTLQPDPAAGADAYLDRQPGFELWGAATTVILDGRNPDQYRPILRFDLSSIPAGVVIDDATLSLYESAGIGNAFTATVHQVTATWDEAQVSWDDRLTGTPWGTAGGDYSPYVAATMSLDNAVGWKTANVTQLVDLWYRGLATNNGLLLVAPNAGIDSDKTFYSSDYLADPTLRPKLDIRYRALGGTGEYVSKVGGPGLPANWQTISWGQGERSFVTDEFDGASLDPKWTWMNVPPAYDVGGSVAGHLRIVSATGVDLDGGTFSGHVLADGVVGDFVATMKFDADPTASGQKAGLLILVNARNWYAIQKANDLGSVNWQAKATVDNGVPTSTLRANVPGSNPIPGWVRLERAGNTFTSSTSDDGIAWTVRDAYAPATPYPAHVRIALFAADGLSGVAHTVDVDYVRVTFGPDAVTTMQTRTGDVTPVDGSWSGWSAAYPTPAGSAMAGNSRYVGFRIAMAVTYPDHSPDVGFVNLSWSNYASSGVLETNDLVPGDVAEWGNFTVVQALGGQTIAYEYSTDSGGSWNPVAPPASLQAVSVATGKIRFRAALSTTDTLVSPTLSEMRLTYRHRLDHFDVAADPAATAGAPFSLTVTAKDAANATLTGWTGTVTLAARLSDGVTPGGGTLGTTSLAISSGGTATLATETYTKAETIRIHASFGSAEGLSANVDVSPGPPSRIAVAPDNVTLLGLDSQAFSAQGYDAWNNPIAGLTFNWTVTGGTGTLNASVGVAVTFTAGTLEANGTVEASFGAIVGGAAVRVVNGTRPWISLASPLPGGLLTGTAAIAYTNSTDAVSVTFEYDAGSGWTLIGSTAVLNGTFLWDTSGLDFVGGSLRATVENNRSVTNATVVSPITVDNTAPSIALGAVTDDQAGSGTLTLTYATSPDVVRVDFTYFDGAWNVLGTDLTVDGTFTWTPVGPVNGVTLRAVARDAVGLTGEDTLQGVGQYTTGANPPVVQALPDLRVRAGLAYRLNLTFYVSDADTALASLSLWTSDPSNVTAIGGPYPGLDVLYAAAGTYTVTLWASDGTDTSWVLVRIIAAAGNPPSLSAPLPGVAFDEDTTAINALGSPLSAYFADADGDTLSFSILDAGILSSQVRGDTSLDLWAAPDAFGSQWVRVRASDPSGAFAEAAFLVVVRPVNDAPVLAAIPDTSAGAGSTGTLDLAPYLSDVDNALGDLTVSTDSPYVTVSGLVLTFAFPAEWTQADVTITVSDGSASAQRMMRVTIVPGAAPWWTSPYLLALPPAGVLVVVAMFAQRAKWRPTKAFLVDERGQLLREFTLDPSCQVTYDQAFEAGALDAVEKPVRVQKYHARSVRGDALGIVLLAYGPVTPDQIEFAREMLVNIQGKFEAAVKDRLADARGYEQQLDAAAARLEKSRTSLESRSRALGDMMNAMAQAQTKMAAEAASLRAKVEDVERREAKIREDRTAVDAIAIQIGDLRSSLDGRETAVAEQEQEAEDRLAAVRAQEERLTGREADLQGREAGLANREGELRKASDEIAGRSAEVEAVRAAVAEREAAVAKSLAEVAEARKALDSERSAFEAATKGLRDREERVGDKEKDLVARESRIQPLEAELAERERTLRDLESTYQPKRDELARKTLEAETRAKALAGLESRLESDREQLDRARATYEGERSAFDARAARLEEEFRRRKEDLDAQGRVLGERQLTLAKEKEAFESERTERTQWIAGKEIDLEAREQSVVEKEAAVRAQAEENARHLAELAAREEALEIGSDKLEKARAEFDAKKADLDKLAKSLDARTAQLREEEATKAEEYRTWQATLESEQAMLREQRDAFEKETTEVRESWAGRMLRLQQREAEVVEREAKVRADVEWVARNEEEVGRREKASQEALRTANEIRAKAEQAHKETEQKAFEIETRERALREEAGRHAEDLAQKLRDLRSAEAAFAETRAAFERDSEARSLRTKTVEAELQERAKALDDKLAAVTGREAQLRAMEGTLKDQEGRVARERTDLQAAGQQLEARQVELAQARQRSEEDAARFRAEAEEVRKALAQREAELQSGMERLTRESTALQEKLGTKARELSVREKALSAQEEELRAEEQELEARLREMESRDRNVQAHQAELAAQAAALAKRQADLDSRTQDLDATMKRFAREEAEKRREWEDLQTAIRSQEARVVADADARSAEVTQRLAELEKQERSLAGAMAQLEMERARLADAAKAQAAKEADAAAAWARSEKRFQELQAMEAALLQTRQSFEAERNAWAARRADELRQLEATRDAATEQAQQTERLIQEAQRRANVAAEAERVARQRVQESETLRAQVEARHADMEKAERALEAQTSALDEASRKLAAREMEINSKMQEFQAREARLAVATQDAARFSEELRAKQAALDQEATRLAKTEADLQGRKAEADARFAGIETKATDLAQRDRVLTTELQRAEGLMEDLNRKETELRSKEKATASAQQELQRKEAALAQKDAELREGLQALEKMRGEIEERLAQVDGDRAAAEAARRETSTLKQEAERMKAQAEEMQKEVSKNMKFLQKKAVDVLDREETIREREIRVEESERSLTARAEVLESKERTLEAEREEALARMGKLQADADRLRAKLAEAEESAKPSAEMEEWKKEIEMRVKIIQKKAFDLLDREEKLRKKEEEIRAKAQELGLTF